MTKLKGVKLEHIDKILIMTVLFDIASMIARMSARLSDAGLIDEDEDNAITTNICGAQGKIGTLLECDSIDISLAAELSTEIPRDIIKAANKLSDMEKLDLDFKNEAEA